MIIDEEMTDFMKRNNNYNSWTKVELIKELKKIKTDENIRKGIKSSNNNELLQKAEDLENKLKIQNEEILETQLLLERSRDLYADLYDFSPVGYVTLSENGKVENCNLTFATLLNVERKWIINNPLSIFLNKEDLVKLHEHLNECKYGSKYCYAELNLKIKDKKPILAGLRSMAISSYEDNKIRFRIAIADITDRTKGEEASKLLASIVESSDDAIYSRNENGIITNWNYAAKRVFGYSSKEIIGKSESIIIPCEKDEDINFINEKIKNGEKVEQFETIRKRKNGKEIIVSITASLIKTKTKDENTISIIARDITAQKDAQEKLRTSLKEKEILIKEIHHRVKNNLQIIISLLNLQSNYLEDKKTISILKECKDRVRSMAMIHEKLYGSKTFLQINLFDYLNDLAAGLISSYKDPYRDIQIKINHTKSVIDIDKAINIGLIMNELVTNSIKYAFPKNQNIKNPRININSEETKNKLMLNISDNGIGIPQSVDFRDSNSLGFLLVTSLVKQIGATIELQNKKGVEFNISIEKNGN